MAAITVLGAHPVFQVETHLIGWRGEPRKGQPKPTKVPRSPDAAKGVSSADPSNWTTFDEANSYAQAAGLNDVMRLSDPAGGLVAIDLDHCRDPESGELTPWASAIVKRLNSYTKSI